MSEPISDPSPQDPNADYQASLEMWALMQQQKAEDLKNLAASLVAMKSMSPGEAIQFAMMNVLPNLMTAQADIVGAAGTTENLSSGLREFVTNMQNAFNAGSQFQPADGKNVVTWIAQLNNILNDPNSPISSATRADLQASLNGLSTLLTGKSANAISQDYDNGKGDISGDAQAVVTNMSAWFPQKPPTTPSFPAQISEATDDFQQLNASVSTLAATWTALQQSLINTYNQLQGITSDLGKSLNTLDGVLIQGETAAR